MWPLDGHLHSGNIGYVVVWTFVCLFEAQHLTVMFATNSARSRLGGDRPSMFADMIVIVEGIVTVVEQRYDLYSWYLLLVDGGSRICNQIYLSQGRDV